MNSLLCYLSKSYASMLDRCILSYDFVLDRRKFTLISQDYYSILIYNQFLQCTLYRLSVVLCYLHHLNLTMQLAEIVNQGHLVSDEIIINLLSKRLEDGVNKGESGFILDGFPRTTRQAVSTIAKLRLKFL